MSIRRSETISEWRTSNPLGIKPKSTPSTNRSPSRSTCVGGASFRPFRLSTITGGHALLSMMGVSRVGLEDRFGLEDSRLVGGLNMFFSYSANGVLLLICDALCSGRTSSTGTVLHRFGLSSRCELGIGTVVGSDMARFRFNGARKGFRAPSSGGGDGGKQDSCAESHELTRPLRDT